MPNTPYMLNFIVCNIVFQFQAWFPIADGKKKELELESTENHKCKQIMYTQQLSYVHFEGTNNHTILSGKFQVKKKGGKEHTSRRKMLYTRKKKKKKKKKKNK